MTVNPETIVTGCVALAALGFGVFMLVRATKGSGGPPTAEVRYAPPEPSIASSLKELCRLFNVLFDCVGSRTIMIGKLIVVDNDKGISVRVQDPRLPSPMEIIYYEYESNDTEFYLSGTDLDRQNKIIEWVRSQIEAEISRRTDELSKTLAIIASIQDETPEDLPPTSME